ncbi:MAG: ChbG/HpnK family deacetylase [Bryobacter sp.]|nr:ChbG/HpnK family deacetylase [Bryobacter sp.]
MNLGIVRAHREGILTATTLMANGAAFDDALRLARETPTLDVGCHAVLVQGQSLVTGKPLPATVKDLIFALARRDLNPYAELRAQLERIVQAGLQPTHIDTHKHTHLLPPVLDALARLAEEFRIRWVRRPFDLPLDGTPVPWTRRAVSRALGFLRRRFHSTLTRHGCQTTDHFAGFSLTGYLRTEDVIRLIENLPAGTTEFMTHPGVLTDELRHARTRLKESREAELRALTAPEVRAALDRAGVQLSGYRCLSSSSDQRS